MWPQKIGQAIRCICDGLTFEIMFTIIPKAWCLKMSWFCQRLLNILLQNDCQKDNGLLRRLKKKDIVMSHDLERSFILSLHLGFFYNISIKRTLSRPSVMYYSPLKMLHFGNIKVFADHTFGANIVATHAPSCILNEEIENGLLGLHISSRLF